MVWILIIVVVWVVVELNLKPRLDLDEDNNLLLWYGINSKRNYIKII